MIYLPEDPLGHEVKMKIPLKNMPRLKLADLLRRRKMTLRQLLDEFGITTYEGLVVRCDRMGCAAPTEAEFKVAFPDKPVNSPLEGVVVLEPPPVIDEITGKQIDPDAPAIPEVKVITDRSIGQLLPNDVVNSAVEEPSEAPQKKQRKKKDVAPGDVS